MTAVDPRQEPRVVAVVRAWTRLYTRGLPEGEIGRRRREIDSDIWENLNDPDVVAPTRTLMGRWLRGVPADVVWRVRTLVEHRREIAVAGGRDRNVWVLLASLFGLLVLTHGVLFGAIGVDDAGDGPRIASLVTAAAAGGLILGGLVARAANPVGGSYAVVVGCLAAVAVESPFGIALSVPLAISGVWSGNLQLSAPGDDTPVLFARRQREDLTRHWYRWLIGAAILGAVGFGAIAIGEASGVGEGCTETDPCLADGIFWMVWILSWFLGMVTGGIGTILGALRLLTNRRGR